MGFGGAPPAELRPPQARLSVLVRIFSPECFYLHAGFLKQSKWSCCLKFFTRSGSSVTLGVDFQLNVTSRVNLAVPAHVLTEVGFYSVKLGVRQY